VVPALDPVRMTEPPWPISGNVGVEGFVNVCGGDLAEPKLASRPGVGEDDVEASTLGLHRRVESVEVGQIGDRAPHRAGIGPEVGYSRVERFLSAAEDEDEGAFIDEALCCGAADAGSAARDDCNLTLKLSHNFSFRGVGTASAPENLDISPRTSGVECGSAHIGGAKSIRPDDRRQPR
jgi:hypothetical protein